MHEEFEPFRCEDAPPFSDYISSAFDVVGVSIFVLGVIGNILTVVVICCSKKLHTPTFTMIACLAVSDTFSLLMFFLMSYTNTIYLVYFCTGMKIEHSTILLTVMPFQGRLNAGTQLCLLASVRYMAIVKPLWFRVHITTKKVVIMSVFGWIFVFIFSLVCAIFEEYVFTSRSKVCNIYRFMNFVSFIIPTSIFIILHCLKLRALRRSPSLNNKSLVRMNVVMTLIVMIYILSSASMAIKRAINCFESSFLELTSIAVLLNCAINPLIYFFASPPILNRLRHVCKRCICTGNNSIEDNINMHVMSS